VPDRIVTIGNRTFYLELKTGTGVVSPLQAHQHEQIRKAGGVVYVAYGWDQIEEVVRNAS
jgi:hypothetical protein